MNVITAFVTGGVSIAVTRLAMPLAHRIGAVDYSHNDCATPALATPLLGGLGVCAGVGAGALLTGLPVSPHLFAAYAPLLTLGLYKDISRKQVHPLLQLAIQIIACGAITIDGSMPLLVKVCAIVGGVTIINALNFLDVIDGLCASVAACVAAALFFVAPSDVSALLVSSLIGFLVWNHPRARIYMGDVGSFFLGILLFQLGWQGIQADALTVSIALVFAVPLFEIVFTTVYRLLRSRSIFDGDNSHLSLVLLNAGVPPVAVIAVFVSATAISGWLAVQFGH